MQKSCYDVFLVETRLGRKIDRIDAAQSMIRGIPHQLLDRRHGAWIGRLPQDREQIACFAHIRFPALNGCLVILPDISPDSGSLRG